MKKLTGKQTRHLRALGHHLQPLVMVGNQGITEKLLASLDANLLAHELIKVKIQQGTELDRHEVAALLAERTNAAVAQILGKTILLYRENKDKPADKRISFPAP